MKSTAEVRPRCCRFYKRDRFIDHLCKVMKEQGGGMVKKLFSVAEAGITSDGQANIKIEKIEAQEYFVFHKAYMATVRSETEQAILKALHELVISKRRCAPLFEDEANFVVFDGSVLVSLYEVENPAHELRHPVLARKTKPQIKTALSYLCDTEDEDGEPMFRMNVGVANVAVYVPPGSDDAETATPSTVLTGEYKKRKEIFAPLVVHRRLLEPAASASSMMDAFFVDFLAIAGGYTDGRRVYAGIEPKSGGIDSMPDHTVRVPPNHKVSVTFPNKLYRSQAVDQMLQADVDIDALLETSDAADVGLQNIIYPPTEREVTFTEQSGFQRLIAERAVKRINPGLEFEEPFITAGFTY